ncbi:chromate transporter [Acetomicrobium sp. S15 = DSM 107314]|jgi:chromate transporter|uniref:chromate transporter n=1 Tax=Acetomicrobium sp. S15 = DSM 107314 TaxID=2529858 RepID=UPI0018E0E7AE|nr:chromate transporter [Acetomicrobium sp. S15 = DSM 107314]
MPTSKLQADALQVTPLKLFKIFLPIGAFTFGGGYAMIPLIRRAIVEKWQWMEEGEFIDAIAIAQSAPGPMAINMAAITGYKLADFSGAASSVIAAALPSFVSIIIIASIFLGVQNNPIVRAAMSGMRPAIVALMAEAAFEAGKTAISDKVAVILAAAAFTGLTIAHIHPIVVILLAGIAGFFIRPAKEEKEERNKAEN